LVYAAAAMRRYQAVEALGRVRGDRQQADVVDDDQVGANQLISGLSAGPGWALGF
jgi:hypothetical protein